MSSPRQAVSGRLQWLGIGFVLYFLAMLYCMRFVRVLPYQIVLIAAILNMTVIVVFVLLIRAEYLRTKRPARSVVEPATEAPLPLSGPSTSLRVVALWVGAGIYALAFINGIGYGIALVGRVPVPVIVLGELFNGGILATFVWAIREQYKKSKASSGRGLS